MFADAVPKIRVQFAGLCAEGRVVVDQHDRVKLPESSNEITGIFRAHGRGYGFVAPQQVEEGTEIAIDSTGLETISASAYYKIRSGCKRKQDGL